MLDGDPLFSSTDVGSSGSSALPPIRLLLASPRGFCAGVRRAIQAVEDALRLYGPPVYVRRAIVHNRAVVASLEAQGAIFVQELSEIPEGAVVILSAHGVAPAVAAEAKRRDLTTFDAVCPLVAKVHREVARHHRDGRHVILVGHEGHPEIVGTLGHVPAGAVSLVRNAADVFRLEIGDDRPVGYAIQTTYSVDEAEEAAAAIEARFGDAVGPPGSDICYATTNRQAAVRAIAAKADAVIVIGEDFSSNACRLAEVARASGCSSVQLVADAASIEWQRLPQHGSIGITAAASTPDAAVAGVIEALAKCYRISLDEVEGVQETAIFKPVKIA